MSKSFQIFLLVLLSTSATHSAETKAPVRIAILGLLHDYASEFIPMTQNRSDVHLVGIVEGDRDLAGACIKQFNLPKSLLHTNLEELVATTNVDAVVAFTATADHARVAEMCASRHLDLMLEKPLAINMRDARAIQAAARSGGIQVMVDYETTWYLANQAAYKLVTQEHAIGELRKIVARDGHRGPKEIGCSETFLKWLTDPELNGGGALPDFGCYGIGLVTWLMGGQRPVSVMAITQQMKPHLYPRVEDEATVLLTYPKMQGIIEASWNSPVSRKDLEIYGTTGSVLAPRKDLLRIRKGDSEETEVELPASPTSSPYRDPLTYLVSVVRGETRPSGPSSLELNTIVIEILDAARESARSGRRIDLPASPAP